MINDKETITSKFNNRFKDLLELRDEQSSKLGLYLHMTPAIPLADNYYITSTTFNNGVGTLTVVSTTPGFLARTISNSLYVPYQFKVEFEVGLYGQGIYLTTGPNLVETHNANLFQMLGPFPAKIVGYFDAGTLIADGSVGIPANPTVLQSPKLYTSNNVAGPAYNKIFGFREVKVGNLELYDDKTDSWYPINNTFMGLATRRINVHLAANKTYTLTIKT